MNTQNFVIGLHALNLIFAAVGIWKVFKPFQDSTKPLGLRLIYLAYPVLTLVNVGSVFGSSGSAHYGLQVLATFLLVASGILFVWTARYTAGRLHLAFCRSHTKEELITEGPFTLVRHPFYLSYLLNFTGALFGLQTPVALVSLAVIVGIYMFASRKEERELLSGKLASQYRRYKKVTPRFLPNLDSICRTISRAPVLPTKISQLKVLSPSSFLVLAAFDWLAIVFIFAIAIQVDHWAVWVLSVFGLGVFQHALGVLGHEATHYAVSKNHNVNDLVGNLLCFWPLSFTICGYRHLHLAHHQHTATEKDPEMELRTNPPRSQLGYVLTFIKDCFGGAIYNTYLKAEAILPRSSFSWVQLGLFWVTVIVVLFAVDSLFVLVPWFAAILGPFGAILKFREYTEHYGIEGTHRFEPGALAKIVLYPHNIWVHDHHHQYAQVPCFNLPVLRSMTQSRVMSVSEVLEIASTETVKPRGSLVAAALGTR